MPTTTRKVKGTTFQFKATSGGSYAAINNCYARQIPRQKMGLDDTTEIASATTRMEKVIGDYGDLVLSILFDSEDTVHAAMMTNKDDISGVSYVKMTEPTGRVTEYVGAAYEFGDKQSGPKDHVRNDYKMHINAVPTETAPG